MNRKISGPFTIEKLADLKAGDAVLLSGIVYTARDAAHKRMTEEANAGQPFPFDLTDAAIYYVGPSPAAPGQVIGSAGPTSSYRMDPYTPQILDGGVSVLIGKGPRGPEVIDAIKRNGAVYFAAVGGAGALISQCIKSSEVIAYEEYGTEAVRKLEIEDMPVIVAIDSAGNSVYER